MRRTLLLFTVMLLMTFTVPAIAATYATPDGDGHPYVVLLTFYYDTDGGAPDTAPVWNDELNDGAGGWDYPDDYQWRCTGTVIDADTVLTAGHCVHGTPYTPAGSPSPDGEATMQLAHVYIDYDSKTVHPAKTFLAGADNPDGANEAVYVTGTPTANDGYNDAWTDFPQTWDYAVVELDEPLSGEVLDSMGTLPTLADVGTFDTYTQRELRGLVFETVGYGLQYTRGPWRFQGDWVRHRAESTLVNLRSANNGGYSFQTSNNKGRYEGGSCFGDSGGPVFLQQGGTHPDADAHVIIGIVSWGYSPNCTGSDWSYRTDLQAVHDFVGQYVDGYGS